MHGDPQLFELRLKSLGLDRTKALAWLAARDVEDEASTSWRLLLEEVLAPANFEREEITAECLTRRPRMVDAALDDRPVTWPIFPELARPFVNVALARLRCVPEFSRWLEPPASEDVARFLTHRLSGLAARTLAYEVKQRSPAGELRPSPCPSQNERGAAEARYADFMQRFVGSPAGLMELFSKYPVLGRLLAVRTEQTITMVRELVERLDRDAGEILVLPEGKGIVGRVARLVLGLSDPHDEGRTVVVVEFATGHRVVYKPRSLAIDAAYANLIAWWNRTVPGLPLKSANVLAREGYGWAEFIEERSCASRAEVADYFRRQGAHTVLFNVLQGTDFHLENFIACGQFPVPIDLECLMSPVRALSPSATSENEPCYRWPAVLATGMTPMWRPGDGGEPCSVDCGIAGNAGRPLTTTVPVWHGLGTDELSLKFERRVQQGTPACLPLLAGELLDAADFLTEIAEGFTTAYRTLLANRDGLCGNGGPLAAFRDVTTRCIVRATTEYSFLLGWSTAPDHLTSAAAHDLAFEMLATYGAGHGSTFDWIDAEKRQLWRRDVPAFYGHPASRRIADAHGEPVGPEFPRMCYEQMESALAAMSDEDLAWQRELLLGSLRMALDRCQESGVRCQMPGADSRLPDTDTRHLTPDTFLLAEAVRLGEALDWLALRCPRGSTWLTLEWEPHDPRAIALAPVRSGLYSGEAGIALFLANLSVAAGEPAFAALARDALRFAAARDDWTLAKWPGYSNRLAAFGSPYSTAYALAECGRVLGDEALLARSLDYVLCQNERPAVENPDFVNGAAGAICVLTHLHALRADDRLLTRAIYLAESIRALNTNGEGWRPGPDAPAVLGLGHGQVGIALALDRLARYAEQPWLRESIRAGLEFEARSFDSGVGDWPNLWYHHDDHQFMVGWCGGAPGHGLARLDLLDGCATYAPLRSEIDCAVATSQRELGPAPENLCCGTPGRMWLLAEAGWRLQRPDWIDAARQAARRLVEDRHTRGHWHLRPVSERESLPTLMGGIAGIGLALLEARRPGSVSPLVTLS